MVTGQCRRVTRDYGKHMNKIVSISIDMDDYFFAIKYNVQVNVIDNSERLDLR